MLSLLALVSVALSCASAMPSGHQQHIPVPYHAELQNLGQHVDLPQIPTKVIRITKTVAIKVPVPYPVNIPHKIPYPVEVRKPYPVVVPQIVKVPQPYPVPVHSDGQGQGYSGGGGGYGGASFGADGHEAGGYGGQYAPSDSYQHGESQLSASHQFADAGSNNYAQQSAHLLQSAPPQYSAGGDHVQQYSAGGDYGQQYSAGGGHSQQQGGQSYDH